VTFHFAPDILRHTLLSALLPIQRAIFVHGGGVFIGTQYAIVRWMINRSISKCLELGIWWSADVLVGDKALCNFRSYGWGPTSQPTPPLMLSQRTSQSNTTSGPAIQGFANAPPSGSHDQCLAPPRASLPTPSSIRGVASPIVGSAHPERPLARGRRYLRTVLPRVLACRSLPVGARFCALVRDSWSNQNTLAIDERDRRKPAPRVDIERHEVCLLLLFGRGEEESTA
jgi:hypothetical protein